MKVESSGNGAFVLILLILTAMVFFAGSVFGDYCGWTRGIKYEKENWQRETIKRGLAEYNAISGNWQWKEPKK